MKPWLLLVMTLGCAYLTYDAFRFLESARRAPFSIIAALWKGRLDHMPNTERAEIQRRYLSATFGIGELGWLFLAGTVALAVATVRAFLAAGTDGA